MTGSMFSRKIANKSEPGQSDVQKSTCAEVTCPRWKDFALSGAIFKSKIIRKNENVYVYSISYLLSRRVFNYSKIMMLTVLKNS